MVAAIFLLSNLAKHSVKTHILISEKNLPPQKNPK